MLPYLYIGLGLLILLLIVGRFTPIRVGDGSEYYAMFSAWNVTHRPWMTSLAYNAYEDLFSSHEILGLVPRDALEKTFPALIAGNTADFNHFWLYSFLAFIFSKIISLTGIDLSTHGSFLVLHFLLVFMTLSISYRYYKWQGVFIVILMTFFSPILWFTNKVHTELFTYCLALSGVIFIYARRYLPSALMFAIASAQNPSFALIAFVPFCYKFILQRKGKYSSAEVIMVVATVFFVLLHPVYYFLRFGVITPQLLAGGASLGGNLSTFYIWIIDPDLGIIPNWPLGILSIIIAIYVLFRNKNIEYLQTNRHIGLFLIFYLLINFYAHSSTTNINSGATPGLARYALWYLPLAFPILLFISKNITFRNKLSYIITLLLVIISILSLKDNNPKLGEDYTTPSRISFFIQKHLPWLYNPPIEVFQERYSEYGEAVHIKSYLAIMGPDCLKLLISPTNNGQDVLLPHNCRYDQRKINAIVKNLSRETPYGKYVNLSKEDVQNINIKVLPKKYSTAVTGDGDFILGSGWGQKEERGIWSEGKIANLYIPCGDEQFFSKNKEFIILLTLQSFSTQNIKFSAKGHSLWKGDLLGKPTDLSFSIPSDTCQKDGINITIDISNPVSPRELGLSDDPRKLGIFLISFEIKADN
ncbi:Predicted integral membrane protein [Yersinia frederiksenii ATCC 33641]|nr:Predicted integral membrane protein [Yersinia frederiksenii ATCC 33641]